MQAASSTTHIDAGEGPNGALEAEVGSEHAWRAQRPPHIRQQPKVGKHPEHRSSITSGTCVTEAAHLLTTLPWLVEGRGGLGAPGAPARSKEQAGVGGSTTPRSHVATFLERLEDTK